ncbi:hypothetical protein MNR01_09470 [Lysobacter sp. S4-A87]|uniref:hypothetical protein n=1 Tax=Lysobacter sp. S4-A87 TaxID=2925843 RepID=UPI001F52FB17|nr:hypothetical protein [Lysobacter sp. S4-A87]UNK48021.1 hypothetical protein MNR01_09470 [Lysobacter sp. S4-A87]
MDTMRTGNGPAWRQWLAVLAAVLVLQAPLVFNPGYFSHDELQWAAFAGNDANLLGRGDLWTGLDSFQYRPLTFSLWLWLSQHLFAHPFAFHGVMVAWGGLNCAMLAALLRRFGVAPAPAFTGALVFALSPFAVQAHGWVGTIGDLIWVGCALATGLLAQRPRAPLAIAVGAAALTAIGLLSKESAIVIPALTAVAWLMLGRPRSWLYATLGALVPVAIYLALRLGVILFAPRQSNYGWSLANLPLRWLEYQVFPPIATRLGITGLLPDGFSDARTWLGLGIWLALAWAFWRAGVRWLVAFVLLGVAALGPVLILAESANQYGYGYAAAVVGLGAAAWARMARAARIVLVLAALLSCWHGVNVMRRMHQIGELQSVFSPSLARAVAASGDNGVRIRALVPGQHWIYLRLCHEIPSYAGVPIGDRVTLVASDAPADYVIGKDGALSPAR